MEWPEDAWLAVSELYRRYGSSLPGGNENVLVIRVAEAFGLTPDTVFKRLANFAARDSGNPNKGLYGGGPDNVYHEYLLMPKRDSLFEAKIKRLRSTYRLKGVI